MEKSDVHPEQKSVVTVETLVKAPLKVVWNAWSAPEHITQWCQASDDWHAPYAENDLRVGGEFKTTMAAKDGSFSFDFGGTYSKVIPHELIEYVMGDGRRVSVRFASEGGAVKVTEEFEAENTNSPEMQQNGWQAILDNFKKHAESLWSR